MTKYPLLLSALLGSVALPVLAQDYVALDEITLSATGLETQVFDSPSAVSIITAEDIESRPRSSVAQILRDIPGILVTQEGIERISIRGESSRRVAILIDGQKLTDHSNYGQPVLIDPASIESIEVVRGASSVVSGTQAIGGVVNIITKRGGDDALSGSINTAYFGASKGTRTSASFGGSQGNFDWRVSLGQSDQGDRKTPDGTLTPSDMSDRSASLHMGYTLGNHYFALKANAYDLAANVYVPASPAYSNFSIGLPQRDLRKVGVYYEGRNLTPWLTSLTADAYTQTIDREMRNDITTIAGPGSTIGVQSVSVDQQTTRGFNLRAEMEFAQGQRTVMGFEYEDDHLNSLKNSDTLMTGFGPFPIPMSTRQTAEAYVRTTSVFAQHEADLATGLTATAGVRYYNVQANLEKLTVNGNDLPLASNSDDQFLGALGLVYAAGENTRLRARVSQGYIYPTLQQLFLTTTAGGKPISGNKDLKPETATTFELGMRHDGANFMLDASAFYTMSEDYIARIDTSPHSATYANFDKARSWGLEVLAEYQAGDWTPYVSATLMQRELQYGNGTTTKDSGTPNLFGTVGVRRTWQSANMTNSVDLFIRGASAAKGLSNAGTVSDEADAYATLNLRGDIAFDNGWAISAEALNLTNASYDPIDEMPGAARSVNFMASYKF